MSAYNCGALARNTVCRFIKPGVCVALLDELVGFALAAWHSLRCRAVFDHHRNPPDVPNPRTGGAGRTMNLASLIPSCSFCRSSSAIASAFRSRCLERLENDEHRAQVRAVGPQHERYAGNPHHVGDPLDAADDLVRLVHHLVGALQRGGVGQLHRAEQIALILGGNETGRHLARSSKPSGRAALRKPAAPAR